MSKRQRPMSVLCRSGLRRSANGASATPRRSTPMCCAPDITKHGRSPTVSRNISKEGNMTKADVEMRTALLMDALDSQFIREDMSVREYEKRYRELERWETYALEYLV